ncbi:MAG: hypothetical protein ACYDBQ_06950 [Thermoplasmatota archaeon]
MADPIRCPHCGASSLAVHDAAGAWACSACGNPVFAPSVAAPGPGTPTTAPRAVAALTLGIVGVAFPLAGMVTGWIAMSFGRKAMASCDANPSLYGGRGLGQAGWILGLVAVILSGMLLLTVILAAVVFVLVTRLPAA